MANKQPKNFSKLFQQKKLTDMWHSKNQSNKIVKKEESDKNNQSGSDDSDFAASFQDTTKSKSKFKKRVTPILPKRSKKLSSSSSEDDNEPVNYKPKSNAIPELTLQNSPRKSKIPSSPEKDNENVSDVSSDGSDLKLNVSDVSEDTSTIPKEEVDEMIQNINDFDSIEMKHDLTGLMADDEMLPNILECFPPIIICKSEAQNTDECEQEQQEQDPLYIDEKEKERNQEQDPPNINEKEKERKQDPPYIDEKENERVLIEQENSKGNTNFNKNKGNNTTRSTDNSDNEQQKLPDNFMKILGKLHIKLQHTVPPQHKIENCAGSRPLNAEQIHLFETYGPLKRGTFTKMEDEIIQNNWKNFCELHDWNEEWVEPFLNMRHEGKYYISNLEERKNFVKFLSNGLPWRSLYSVYSRFKNLYNLAQNGPYTREEDISIIKYLSKTESSKVNKKCAELAKTLNRKRHSIWQRYQKLRYKYSIPVFDSHDSDLEDEKEEKKKSSSRQRKTHVDQPFKKVYKTVSWTTPLVNRFIEKLLKITSCQTIEELKNQTFTDEIWKKMEREISIDNSVLQNFWNFQLYMQLFFRKPLCLNELRVDLIQYLYKNKRNEDSIDWDAVKIDFNGITSAFLSKVFDDLVKCVKRKLRTTCTKKIIKHLYITVLPDLMEKTSDVLLPKVDYIDDRIVGVNEASFKRPSKGMTSNPFELTI